MTMETALSIGQQGLFTAMLIAGPLLITALTVGTLVSLFQAVTQIQEITLVFVPKIASVFLVLALAGGWMMQTAVGFGTLMFESIAETE
jgi:flagellar biosynthesis protein FliQ